MPTDVRCGFYLLEKTLAYSGKKLFAGLKSSMQEQLKKACKHIKKGFRTEYGKTGLNMERQDWIHQKNMIEDRFKSQRCRKQHILEWKSNPTSSAPMGTAQRYFWLSEQAMHQTEGSHSLTDCEDVGCLGWDFRDPNSYWRIQFKFKLVRVSVSEICPFWHAFYIVFWTRDLHFLGPAAQGVSWQRSQRSRGPKGQYSSPASISARGFGEQTLPLLNKDNHESHPRDFSLQWPNQNIFIMPPNSNTLKQKALM